MKVFVVVLLALAALAQAKEINVRRNLDGYQVLTAIAKTSEQYETLKKLSQNIELDFWTSPRLNGKTDIMASPKNLQLLTAIFKLQGFEFEMKIENVGRMVEEQRVENDRLRALGEGRMSWTAYESYDDVIVPWIQSLEELDVATVSVIGQSSEGRDLYMVRVSTGPGPDGQKKPVVLIDSNLHAREWIAGAVGTWILNEFTSKPDQYAEFLDRFDVNIIPMANPDGYEYSQSTDRMWRKTRSLNAGETCRGCDPNRNFGFFWGGESTSSDPCSDIYKGEEAFSEPETQAIRDVLKNLQAEGEVFAYYTLHSYGQLWLLSWGYTQGEYPDDYPELYAWGKASTDAIKAAGSNTAYEYGQGADMLYGVGGASDDYAKSEGVTYVATIELRDTGRYGFLLPPNQILDTAKETMAGIQVLTTRSASKRS